MKSWVSVALVTLGLTTTTSGCFVSTDSRPRDNGDSLLTVEWTIEGATDPDDCIQSAVDAASIVIYDRSDREVVNEEVACEDFGADYYLPDGTYWVSVILIDRSGDPRTVEANTDNRRLFDGTSDYVVLNFESDSFL